MFCSHLDDMRAEPDVSAHRQDAKPGRAGRDRRPLWSAPVINRLSGSRYLKPPTLPEVADSVFFCDDSACIV